MAIFHAFMAVLAKVKRFYRAGLKSFSHLPAADMNNRAAKAGFFLAHLIATIYIPQGDSFPIFEPDDYAPWCARYLR
jgi:hypothetical protein